MSRIGWIVGAVAALVVLSGNAQTAQRNGPEQQRITQTSPAPEGEASEAAPNRQAPQANGMAALPEAGEYPTHTPGPSAAKGCPNSGQDKHLEAEERAAAAAENQIPPAWLAVIFGAVGTGLILLTLLETRRAGEAQAQKMRESVDQATRAANAMEHVAESMAANVEQIVESVKIMDANAEVQRTFGMTSIRAYIDVIIGHAIYQTDSTIFEAVPYMTNSGSTPARNVRWKIAADILPVPLPDDFSFPLGTESIGENTLGSGKGGGFSATIKRRVPEAEVAAIKGASGSALYCWGVITYVDMFQKKRRTEFAQLLYWEPSGEVREDGVRPEIVKGYHLERHSRTT